jgi:Na+/H+-dicarboxylate symporter
MLKTWQQITLWKRVLFGLIVGMVIGLAVRYTVGPETASDIATNWFKPFGTAFVRLIKMLIIPLISTTLVVGVTSMGDPKKLGSLGARTIVLYLFTTLFAVSLGLAIGTLVRPGVGVEYQDAGSEDVEAIKDKIDTASEAGTFVDRLLEIIPENPVEALATGSVLPTIFFAIILGIGILFVGESADPIKNFFDAAAKVVMRITMLVMEFAPFGVLFLMAWVMADKGIEVIVNMGKLAFALYFACTLQIIFIYGGLLVRVILRLPMRQFFRGILDAQGVAFSTASSNATLPVTISCAEKNLGVEKSIAGSVLPLGATINMDGTAIYLGLIALFAVQADGRSLEFSQYLMVALTATLVSIGAAGIPSAGLLLAATVLGVVGVDNDQAVLVIAFIFPFDRLLDMMRTATNISGDLAVACAVAKWEGSLDEETFRADAEL